MQLSGQEPGSVLTFLSEFGMLFALVTAVLLVVAWRKGWFSEHLADEISVQPKEGDGFFSARRLAAGRGSDALSQKLPAGAASDVRVTPAAIGRAATDNDDDTRTVTAIAHATRMAQWRAAKEHPDYWSKEAIQQRAGWLLFDPSDFLGAPDKVFEMPIPETDTALSIPLFAAARVRQVERDNTLIAMSRRKVVQSRWDRRDGARSRSLR